MMPRTYITYKTSNQRTDGRIKCDGIRPRDELKRYIYSKDINSKTRNEGTPRISMREWVPGLCFTFAICSVFVFVY